MKRLSIGAITTSHVDAALAQFVHDLLGSDGERRQFLRVSA
jgi:hypothetical protein